MPNTSSLYQMGLSLSTFPSSTIKSEEITNRIGTIGIIGGGQLARMSAQAAQRLGFQVAVMDHDEASPASQVTNLRVCQEWNSEVGTVDLAKIASVVTLENEWVAPENLRRAEECGAKVFPGWKTLALIRDKYLQRVTFQSHGLRSPRFMLLHSWDDARQAASEWGLPLVLKSRHGGYDGYGVVVIRESVDWDKVAGQSPSLWYAEEYISFDAELAVIVSRNPSGETAVYPVVESRQTVDGHRCDLVIAPATNISRDVECLASQIALEAVESVEGVGLFGVELFLVGDQIVVNEIAPRPHNSGHYTMDGSMTSQFEQHIRSIKDLPLGPTDLLAPAVIMANLLAPREGEFDFSTAIRRALRVCPDAHLHWYGKSEMRKDRKMGHLNLLGEDFTTTLARAIEARAAFWGELE